MREPVVLARVAFGRYHFFYSKCIRERILASFPDTERKTGSPSLLIYENHFINEIIIRTSNHIQYTFFLM